MSVSMEGLAWLGVSKPEGPMLPLGQVEGLLLHVHATMPLLTHVGLGFMGERCVWLLGTDSGKGNPVLLAAPQARDAWLQVFDLWGRP